MIKENDRCGEDSRFMFQNQTDSLEYEKQIIDLQNQIEALNEKLIENSYTFLELKQNIKKLEMQEQERDTKIKQLNAKIESINKAQKDKRNRHLKEIYNLKKSTYLILQKYVKHEIFDENDENFYDFESNLENILDEITQQQENQKQQIKQIFEKILETQHIVYQKIQFNTYEQYFSDLIIQIKQDSLQKQIENKFDSNIQKLKQSIEQFIENTITIIRTQLNQKNSFCKNIEENKTQYMEITLMINSINLNQYQLEDNLNVLLQLLRKIISFVA